MKILLLALPLLLISTTATAQGVCSPANPCVQLPISNPNSAPTSTVIWSCMGGSTSCSAAALSSIIAQQTPTTLCPAVSSVWTCVTFSQSKTPQLYNDPEPWGALMNYSTQGTANGGVSASSPIVVFQVPAAPAQPPSIGSVPKMVTSGSVGPQ